MVAIRSDDYQILVDAYAAILGVLDKDAPLNPDTNATPHRCAKWLCDFKYFESGDTGTAFLYPADQMVLVKGIKVWSLCEHHLLPFSCEITMAVITKEKVLGLSKYVRIAQEFAHKLQTQERLAQQIANELQRKAGTDDVAVVVANGMHLCMMMRGVRTAASMTSSVLYGAFREDPKTREEFFSLLRKDG